MNVTETSGEGGLSPFPSPYYQVYACGSFLVKRWDGASYQPVPIGAWGGSHFPRVLLKILLCSPGRQIARGRLMELLWPDIDPEDAARYLSDAAYRLRTVLRPTKGGESLLLTAKDTSMYALVGQEQLWVDADAALALLEQAEAMEQHSDQALLLLEDAASTLSRGEFLAEEDHLYFYGRRARIARARRGCLLALAQAYQQSGRLRRGEALLSSLLEENVLDEDALGALMLNLHRQGRTSEGLRLYEETRTLLEREGVAPTEATRVIEQQLRGGSPVLKSLDPQRYQTTVPMQIKPVAIDWGEAPSSEQFYGRQQELSLLSTWIQAHHCRVVAIFGMGGIGKTSLAVRLVERVKDGFMHVFWRSLHQAPPLHTFLEECLRFLSDQQQIRMFEDLDAAIAQLVEIVRQRRVLLILDNCETILQSGVDAGMYREDYEDYGRLIRRLGEVQHQSCLLLTSRESMKEIAALEGESGPVRTYHVQELPQTSLIPQFWNVPYQRNPFFTGRDDILSHLHALLTGKHAIIAVTQQALCGLGGIGKTQLVLEYAYRYANEYQAVFWINADTRENLSSDFLALATLLSLPERDAHEQMVMMRAIQRWLREHTKWLLIFDNADEIAITREVLPTGCQGHILLTTRAQAMGRVAHRLEVEEMDQETGTLFLLRRAGIIRPDAPLETVPERKRILAEELVREFGGLPLALDQAGAYIEETASSLQDYLDFYHTYRLALLQRRGGLTTDHPESVATTWQLSFTRIENSDSVAASLLRLCAFLDPDAIPEELLFAGLQQAAGSASEIHQLRFIEAIGSLLRFSVVRRNAYTHTIIVHRLIQGAVRDNLLPEQQVEWMHQIVQLLSEVFPSATQVTNWPLCEKFLPHALLSAHWIEQADITSMQAASLLDTVGYYLNMRARYEIAKPLFQRALRLREQILGEQHPDTAQTLSNLAYLYHHQDQFEEAMPFLQRSLSIRQQVFGMKHPETATSLNALGLLYRDQKRYEEAEPFFQQALAIRKQIFGTGHPQTAHSLSNLAWLYRNLRKYQEAEALYEQSLAIRKRMLGVDHPETATSLNGLALLYAAQKKYAKAEPLFQQALTIRQQVLGTKHLHTTQSMNALALLYYEQGEYEKAKCLFLEVVAIREHLFGSTHPRTLVILNNLIRCQEQVKK